MNYYQTFKQWQDRVLESRNDDQKAVWGWLLGVTIFNAILFVYNLRNL